MDMNQEKVRKIIGDHKRFISPDQEPYGYYIFQDSPAPEEIELYFEKLNYAVSHAESLIRQAFGDGQAFYDYIFKNFDYDKKIASVPENFSSEMKLKLLHCYEEMHQIHNPEQMFQKLRFDSFVLHDHQIGAYLSGDFMFGNFIEAVWDENWNLQYSWIC